MGWYSTSCNSYSLTLFIAMQRNLIKKKNRNADATLPALKLKENYSLTSWSLCFRVHSSELQFNNLLVPAKDRRSPQCQSRSPLATVSSMATSARHREASDGREQQLHQRWPPPLLPATSASASHPRAGVSRVHRHSRSGRRHAMRFISPWNPILVAAVCKEKRRGSEEIGGSRVWPAFIWAHFRVGKISVIHLRSMAHVAWSLRFPVWAIVGLRRATQALASHAHEAWIMRFFSAVFLLRAKLSFLFSKKKVSFII